MTKQEVAEIKKLFTQRNCSITRICGCYVDGEKNKKTQFKDAFLSLPEEEMFKYFEILKKSLSGKLGKNLMNLEFPLHAESAGGEQAFMLKLRDSKLKNDEFLEQYFDKIIESYEYVGNYLILVFHDVYDVPGKTSDGQEMDDASDEIYEYILTCICPVELSKPGLSYNAGDNVFQNRIRDWVVSLPETAILFPAFNDRSTDVHGALYYSKNAKDLKWGFTEQLLGCTLSMSAETQREAFQTIVEETLGSKCNFETVKNMHDKINELIEEHKDDPEPLAFDKKAVERIFAESGVDNDAMGKFGTHYDDVAGAGTELLAGNVANGRAFEVSTPEINVKVKPERTDLLEIRSIDGRKCLVIELSDDVSVNGIRVVE